MTTQASTLTPQLSAAFARVLAYVEAMQPDEAGFTADEVHVPLTQLKALEERFFLKPSEYRSKSHWGFSLPAHPGALPEWAKAANERERQAEIDEAASIDRHIFDDVIGYEYEKDLILDSLVNLKPVNFGIMGPPAGAKSIILEAIIAAIPDTMRAYGGNVTRAGINAELVGRNPRIIAIDEADKLAVQDWAALGEIAERHSLTVVNGNMRVVQPMRAQLFVAGNDPSLVPEHMRSRMAMLHFGAYNHEDFCHVAELLLMRQLETERGLAREIAEWCWAKGVRDIRQVRTIATLCPDLASVKRYLESANRLTDADIEEARQRRRRGVR